jgi:hypothetical protein
LVLASLIRVVPSERVGDAVDTLLFGAEQARGGATLQSSP